MSILLTLLNEMSLSVAQSLAPVLLSWTPLHPFQPAKSYFFLKAHWEYITFSKKLFSAFHFPPDLLKNAVVLSGHGSSLFCVFRIPYGRVGEGNGTPLQYSCLENPMDGGAWWAAVHGIPKSQTRMSNFPFTFPFHILEKEMATHSSVHAWRIPGMREPGGLPSEGSHRVGHD